MTHVFVKPGLVTDGSHPEGTLRRVRLPDRRWVPDEGMTLPRDVFVERRIRTGDLVVADAAAASAPAAEAPTPQADDPQETH